MRVQHAIVEHHRWLRDQLGGRAFCADFKAIEAVNEEGKIMAMVGFDRCTYTAAECHYAAPNFSGMRALLRPMFDYIFNQVGKQLILTCIPSHSVNMINFALKLGFEQYARIQDGYKLNDDTIRLVMRKRQCRFLGKV